MWRLPAGGVRVSFWFLTVLDRVFGTSLVYSGAIPNTRKWSSDDAIRGPYALPGLLPDWKIYNEFNFGD